jgi:hypothetical protein
MPEALRSGRDENAVKPVKKDRFRNQKKSEGYLGHQVIPKIEKYSYSNSHNEELLASGVPV